MPVELKAKRRARSSFNSQLARKLIGQRADGGTETQRNLLSPSLCG